MNEPLHERAKKGNPPFVFLVDFLFQIVISHPMGEISDSMSPIVGYVVAGTREGLHS